MEEYLRHKIANFVHEPPFNFSKTREEQTLAVEKATAKLFDQTCLGERTIQNPNHLRFMYDVFSDSIDKEGNKMVKELNKVVAY